MAQSLHGLLHETKLPARQQDKLMHEVLAHNATFEIDVLADRLRAVLKKRTRTPIGHTAALEILAAIGLVATEDKASGVTAQITGE
jgi:3-methyladenine DNA glycosylase Tag